VLIPPQFDQDIAQESALLVTMAYDQSQNPAWNLGTGYQVLGTLETPQERFGFVAQNVVTKNVFVVFRGTATPLDWMADLSFPQVNYSAIHPEWGKVEQGFWDVYQSCSQSVINAVKSAAGAPHVYVTGHSLGGALATLATADLAINAIPAVMYSLASPRVGDPTFTARFNAQVTMGWRIANTEDIVTTVPLATPNLEIPVLPHNALGILLMLSHDLDYTHVGAAVNFTVNHGSVVQNHAIATYSAALAVT
jgi:triacylglycerol lipase